MLKPSFQLIVVAVQHSLYIRGPLNLSLLELILVAILWVQPNENSEEMNPMKIPFPGSFESCCRNAEELLLKLPAQVTMVGR